MKLITAGESHGKALTGIIEGLPSNLKIDIDEINRYLALRQSGYGRGGRQKIEKDRVEILSGVRNCLTLGSPLAFAVVNSDYANWKEYMAPEGCDTTQKTLTKVRPGSRGQCRKAVSVRARRAHFGLREIGMRSRRRQRLRLRGA